jgi:hypothetical protein
MIGLLYVGGNLLDCIIILDYADVVELIEVIDEGVYRALLFTYYVMFL